MICFNLELDGCASEPRSKRPRRRQQANCLLDNFHKSRQAQTVRRRGWNPESVQLPIGNPDLACTKVYPVRKGQSLYQQLEACRLLKQGAFVDVKIPGFRSFVIFLQCFFFPKVIDQHAIRTVKESAIGIIHTVLPEELTSRSPRTLDSNCIVPNIPSFTANHQPRRRPNEFRMRHSGMKMCFQILNKVL